MHVMCLSVKFTKGDENKQKSSLEVRDGLHGDRKCTEVEIESARLMQTVLRELGSEHMTR